MPKLSSHVAMPSAEQAHGQARRGMSALSRTLTPAWVTRHRAGWIALGAAIVLVLAGTGGYLVASSGSSPASAQVTTTTETVSTGTLRQTVTASGTLAPAVDDTLAFSSSGVVTSVVATVGQAVSKGQKLATIDSASLAATVAQDNATVATDQAKVDDDTDVSAAQLTADQAALTAAENALSSAKTALAGAALTSPISGVVASVGLTVGEQVSGSGSGGSGSGGSGSGGSGGSGSGSSGSGGSGTGSAASSDSSSSDIEVISTNSWIVNATVDATSVALIKAGEEAQLAVTGVNGTIYGTISTIAVLPSSTEETASYPVVIAVTGSPSGLLDGEQVTASLIYKQLADVLLVPTIALHRASDGSEYVNKVINGKVEPTTVQVGLSSGAETQVTSGLSVGDVIQIQVARPGAGTGGGSTTRTGTFGGGTGRGGFGGGGFGEGGFGGGGTGEGGFGGGGFGGAGGAGGSGG
jgi:membrane fusion protein, macrolide-specific efflux system